MAKGLRPARCYRWDSPTYTRVSKNPGDSYITGIPGNKIVHFCLGNPQLYDLEVSIVYEERIMVRHNALDSSRIAANKVLEKRLGQNFSILIRTYPHHVMRENAMASGAGADRVQEGMRLSFGKPVGRAAKLYKKQKILSLYVNRKDVEAAKAAAQKSCYKLPGRKHITVEENSIQRKTEEI